LHWQATVFGKHLHIIMSRGPSSSPKAHGLNRLKILESFAGNLTNLFSGPGGRLNKVQLPGSNWFTNWFDPAGQLLSRWLKNSGGTTLDSYVYTHDLTGLSTNLVRSDGAYANYSYDPIGQLTNAVAREPGGALRRNENFAYAYDAAGNLATRLNATLTQTFSVDNANQLTSASRSGTLTAAGTANTLAQSVSVNSVGADLYTDKTFATTNGLTLTNGNNQLRFKATDAYSQSVTITQLFNMPATVSYTYDLNGNLVSDGARGYDYDDANQLIRISATNQWKSEFVYDALGRRLIRREYIWQRSAWLQVDEVRYVWLGMSVLQERNAANNVRVTYTGRLAREDANSTCFYFSDGNGNLSSLIDSSGNIKARYRYDSFGNLLSKSGSLADANLIRFSGKKYHANSGLYYYGFRLYAPNLQRWLNEDPIGLSGGMNLHALVGNDPINVTDPFGLKTGDWYDPTTYLWPSLAELEGQGQLDQRAKEMGYGDYLDAMVQLDAHPGRDTCDQWTGRQMQQAVSAAAGSAGELASAYLEVESPLATGGVATRTAKPSVMGEATAPGWWSKLWNRLFGKGAPNPARPLERALGNAADVLAEQAAKSCPAAAKSLPDSYAGIRQASQYLQEMGVSRADRVRYLQSFEPQNMVVRQAGQSEFGLRYFSDPSRAGGQYPFETFPASRASLAIKPEWSSMSGFRQFQIRPGATILEGRAAAQGPYLPGGQMQKFILDWRSDLIP
jgi:RHS repeat-associated protein